jgi:uncharacterized protein YuzE
MKKTKIHYDSEVDTLYISFGNPKPCYAEQIGDGVYLRFDDETDEINGVTITHFSQNIDGLKKLKLPFDIDIKEIENVLH